MATVPLSRGHSIEIRRKDDLLRFALHDGKEFLTPAFRLDQETFMALLRCETRSLHGEMKGPVEVSIAHFRNELDVSIDGNWCGTGKWTDWMAACREAWGGQPFS